MKQGFSKKAYGTGIPLRQTNPASVEKYLVEKIREDLGSFKDLAIIKPSLRVDSTDSDLSGNISNGFGLIELDVRGVKVHVPFIIHDKELIPFDVIRLGEQEVAYDPSKLRQVVNGIDKKIRDEGETASSEGFEFGNLADPKNVPTGNGFLGNIMQVRDDEMSRGGVGNWPYEGAEFGTLDDDRLGKRANEVVDVLEVFSEAMDKLASVKVIPASAVQAYAEHIEKTAADESQKQIDAVSSVQPDSMEAAGVRRGMAKLKDEKLADISRVASGNNIKFPIADQGRFTYRNGRVYHKVEPWVKNDKERVLTPVRSVVLDSKAGYRFIMREGDKFMTTLDNPPHFEMAEAQARVLSKGHMYALEIAQDTLSHPFRVNGTSNDMASGFFIATSDKENSRRENSLFLLSIHCEEVMPAKAKDHNYVTNRSFTILIARDQLFDGIKYLTSAELGALIEEKAQDPDDSRLAHWMADYSQDCYIVSSVLPFFKLEHLIEGYFTRPDGYFKEGPLVKQAAYGGLNQATLVVEKDRLPRNYALKWQYSDESAGNETSGTVQLQKRQLTGLSEDKARQLLSQLGYDNRQMELFFEITKRNGRQASFDLPDVNKAKALAPGDIAAQKTKKTMSNIGNATFNANNFMPILEDVMAEGLSGFLGNVAPQTADWARKVDGWLKISFETAVEFEKIATKIGGQTWHELSALTNLKHRLDKTASEILYGNYLSGMHDVLEKVASLKPAVSKHTQDLISFNRQQLLAYDKPPVSPKLVKQALHELDGLYRYATALEDEEPAASKKKKSGAQTGAEVGAGVGGAAGLFAGMHPIHYHPHPNGMPNIHYPGLAGGIPGAVIGAGIGAAAGSLGGWAHDKIQGAIGHKKEAADGSVTVTKDDLANVIKIDPSLQGIGKPHRNPHFMVLTADEHARMKPAWKKYGELDTMPKQAAVDDQGPYRTPIPLFGEHLVGRSGAAIAGLIPHEAIDNTVGAAINGVDGLMDRLNKTASEELPGKSLAPSDELGASAPAIEKQANLFTGYNNMRKLQKEQVGRFGELMTGARKELDDVQWKLRNSHIYLRSLMNQGQPNPAKQTQVEEEIRSLKEQSDFLQNRLHFFGVNQGEVQQALTNSTLGITAAVGVPALAGLAYADSAWKNK